MSAGTFPLAANARPAAGERRGGEVRLPVWAPFCATLLLALLVTALDPTVFIGGGYDDWHYLQAARCAAEHGLCLARDHWWSRLPLVLPLGAAVAALGETKLALGLVPAAYALAALLFFTTLVQRQFGRAEALVAGLAFAATPVIGRDFVRLSIDLPELSLLLAALFALQQSRRGGTRWSLAAGLAFACAVEARATSLVALAPFAALLAWGPFTRRDRIAFAAALGGFFLLQALADLAAAGDALHHWRLQLGHTRLASSELPATAAASGSPIFNLAIVAAWPPAAGVHVHWALDALLNLLVHPETGLTLFVAGLLIAASLGRTRTAEMKPVLLLLAAAACWFGGLVFALAIDPKPRMFEPVMAAAAAIVGVLAARHWRKGERALPLVCLIVLIGWGLVRAYDVFDRGPVAAAAGRAMRSETQPFAVEEATWRFVALEPGARRFPVYRGDEARRLYLVGAGACRGAADGDGFKAWRVAREERFERLDPPPLAALRARGILLHPQVPPVLCLLTREL